MRGWTKTSKIHFYHLFCFKIHFLGQIALGSQFHSSDDRENSAKLLSKTSTILPANSAGARGPLRGINSANKLISHHRGEMIANNNNNLGRSSPTSFATTAGLKLELKTKDCQYLCKNDWQIIYLNDSKNVFFKLNFGCFTYFFSYI